MYTSRNAKAKEAKKYLGHEGNSSVDHRADKWRTEPAAGTQGCAFTPSCVCPHPLFIHSPKHTSG